MPTNAEMITLPLSQLRIDSTTNVPIKPHVVKRMAKSWNDLAYTPIVVNERLLGSGRYTVIVGQHRYLAAREHGKLELPCYVHRGLTPEQEAQVFLGELARRGIPKREVFGVMLRAEHPVAVAANAVAEALGQRISDSGGGSTGENIIRCPAAVLACQQSGTWSTVADVVVHGLPGQPDRWRAEIVRGLDVMLRCYGTAVDLKRLKEVLQRAGTGRLNRDYNTGHGPRVASGGSGGVMAMAVVALYNSRLREDGPTYLDPIKLMAWRKKSTTGA